MKGRGTLATSWSRLIDHYPTSEASLDMSISDRQRAEGFRCLHARGVTPQNTIRFEESVLKHIRTPPEQSNRSAFRNDNVQDGVGPTTVR